MTQLLDALVDAGLAGTGDSTDNNRAQITDNNRLWLTFDDRGSAE
ncbi:hypothetical protein Ppa06_68620 [Planomonospora parontospora subsp. parontospora]|uniref:Uncharacterized protein n=2 Tax=Planomonospora parontospora TaxID=58119 RepID=A0AA37BQ06_9ACTN|nr:hypothetical protein [Planomonospora parontospora]GGK99846.1 hypothetical protein GCM10010126_69310 [Planomonospora parontospora]GII13064.1 hypothetical protein Ppa06_68620 [Planomonospora parontospora subsp. parontospora]